MCTQNNRKGGNIYLGWQWTETPTTFYGYIFHNVESFLFLFYAYFFQQEFIYSFMLI